MVRFIELTQRVIVTRYVRGFDGRVPEAHVVEEPTTVHVDSIRQVSPRGQYSKVWFHGIENPIIVSESYEFVRQMIV